MMLTPFWRLIDVDNVLMMIGYSEKILIS